jgi:hypothetical protein
MPGQNGKTLGLAERAPVHGVLRLRSAWRSLLRMTVWIRDSGISETLICICYRAVTRARAPALHNLGCDLRPDTWLSLLYHPNRVHSSGQVRYV